MHSASPGPLIHRHARAQTHLAEKKKKTGDMGTKLRRPSVSGRSVSRPAVYLITAVVRVTAPPALLAGEVLPELGEVSRRPS